MKKFLKSEEHRLILLLVGALLIICVVFIYLYSICKELSTVIFIPIELEIVKKIIITFLDISNKPKLMNEAKLFHECGVITDEEYEEKKRYIRQMLEDIGYVERTTELPTNQKEKSENNTSNPYEEVKQLKELFDMGIITQEEFDQKKKDLLDL